MTPSVSARKFLVKNGGAHFPCVFSVQTTIFHLGISKTCFERFRNGNVSFGPIEYGEKDSLRFGPEIQQSSISAPGSPPRPPPPPSTPHRGPEPGRRATTRPTPNTGMAAPRSRKGRVRLVWFLSVQSTQSRLGAKAELASGNPGTKICHLDR